MELTNTQFDPIRKVPAWRLYLFQDRSGQTVDPVCGPDAMDYYGVRDVDFVQIKAVVPEVDINDVGGQTIKYRDALVFVRQWFQKLEDGTPADDPLRSLRLAFHRQIHAKLDEVLGTANAKDGAQEHHAEGSAMSDKEILDWLDLNPAYFDSALFREAVAFRSPIREAVQYAISIHQMNTEVTRGGK